MQSPVPNAGNEFMKGASRTYDDHNRKYNLTQSLDGRDKGCKALLRHMHPMKGQTSDATQQRYVGTAMTVP